ncbi:zinc-binding dehydrogenase [Cladochytrium replicatum]|nr:zinc-binding dehydrogenase [Cladochytrium replicatum]
MSATIRKVVVAEFGDVSKVNVVEANIDAPPAKHVQISTVYSGFSGGDIEMRTGVYPMVKKAPFTPGYSLVGTVKANGPESFKFKPGDIVASLTVYDAQAELVNLPEKYLVKVPDGLDLQQVTALVLDWNTAYAMVVQSAKVAKGQRVFVHGVSGAVGYALMKLCQLQGAEVYGTASERNHAAIRDQGGIPFVYTDKNWIKAMNDLGGVHAVFDALGFESFDESFSILAEDGILVAYGANLQLLNETAKPRSVVGSITKLLARGINPFSRKRTTFYFITRDHPTFVPNLNKLFELLAEGRITVPIKKVWDLEDIQEAHRQWSSGTGVGSIVIRVSAPK